jgi:hypothetical protein
MALKNSIEPNIPQIQAWIKRIIDSCENTFHFEGAQVLINKFKEICDNEKQWVEVQDYFNLKYNGVHAVIKN